jgi:hypothetical protein
MHANLIVVSTERKTPIESATQDALLTWIEAFPTKELETRLTTLLKLRRQLDMEIRFLQAQVLRYRQYLEDLRPDTAQPDQSGAEGETRAATTTDQRHPPKRMAVLRLLSETPGRTWRLADIRKTLVERGWLEDSDRARHALQVALLGMAKRGELEKPRTGFYRLATDETASVGTNTDEPGEPLDRDSVPGELEDGAGLGSAAPSGA